MSEEQSLSEAVENTFDSDPQHDFDSPEYIQSVVNEFSDVLGLGGPPPEKPQPPEAQPDPQEQQQAEAATEQAGDPNTTTEQAAPAPEPSAGSITNPQISDKSQSQLIEERAALDAAKRDAEEAKRQAIEEARREAQEEIYKELRLKPREWIKSLREKGLDPGEMAMVAYAEALGDKAPPELLKRVSQITGRPENIMSEVDRKLAEQEKKFEERQRQLELKQIALGYEEYLVSVPESEPYLKAAVGKNKAAVKQNLFKIADAYAAEYGRYPTTSELTAEYNRQVTEIAELHGIALPTSTSSQPATPSTPKVAPKQTTTLSDNFSDRANSGVEPEDLSDEALERAAIEFWKSQQRG